MRDGIVYCRLHYEMLQHPGGTLTGHHQSHQHGLLMSHPPHQHHHSIQGNNNGLIGGPDGPCDLSCGPHHGLLPPPGFHHPHHLMPPESVSPSQHMINILSSGVDPAVDPSYPTGLRPNVFGSGGGGAVGGDYLHNPSANDFQRCLSVGNPAAGFFPSLSSSNGGNSNSGLGGSSPGAGSLGHHHQHSVQKGRPRKRKIPSAAAAAAALHSNNNNNNNGNSAGNHSDSSILGQQQHLNAANLRQLTSGIGKFPPNWQELVCKSGLRFKPFVIFATRSRPQKSNSGQLVTITSASCRLHEYRGVCDGRNHVGLGPIIIKTNNVIYIQKTGLTRQKSEDLNPSEWPARLIMAKQKVVGSSIESDIKKENIRQKKKANLQMTAEKRIECCQRCYRQMNRIESFVFVCFIGWV